MRVCPLSVSEQFTPTRPTRPCAEHNALGRLAELAQQTLLRQRWCPSSDSQLPCHSTALTTKSLWCPCRMMPLVS